MFLLGISSQFLSTPSVWRVTSRTPPADQTAAISIHTLRVEGDPGNQPKLALAKNISIHTLRVEGDPGNPK